MSFQEPKKETQGVGIYLLSPPKGEFVIDAGWVLSCDERDRFILLRNASLLIKNDRIEMVTCGSIEGDFPRVSNPKDIILPGFISGHTHTCIGTPTRGLIEGGRSYVRPIHLVESLSDEEIDDLTAANLLEILRSGCTTQLEMSSTQRRAESYVRVAKKWGLRGYPNSMIPNTMRLHPIWHRQDDRILFESVPETLAEIEKSLAFAKSHMGAANGRIIPMMTPHATDTHTPETMQAIVKAAKELGTGIHIHLSQRVTETAAVRRLWGVTPTQWVEKLGFFDMPFFAAHMTGMDLKIDPPLFAKHNAAMVHCPSGGGAGFSSQPYPEALAAGMKVNVGIDTHSNDYLENLKLAVLYGKIRTRLLETSSPVPMVAPTMERAIEGATIIPARVLRRDDLGRIKKGAKADLISIDITSFPAGPGALPPDPLNNLLYANGTAIRNVLIDGQFKVFCGKFVVEDEEIIRWRGGNAVKKIWAQLESEGWFIPPNPTCREAQEHLPPQKRM